MGVYVVVTLRGGKDDIYSPEMEREAAEAELLKIRTVLGTMMAPDVPWMAAQGTDILGAKIAEPSY